MERKWEKEKERLPETLLEIEEVEQQTSESGG